MDCEDMPKCGLDGRTGKQKTMLYSEFRRLCVVNSSKTPSYVEIDGRRRYWVGIGITDHGPAWGTEVKILEG